MSPASPSSNESFTGNDKVSITAKKQTTKEIAGSDRRFPCRWENCQYTSATSSGLERHIRTHTGEKPPRCPHCPYRAVLLVNLERHIRNAHTHVKHKTKSKKKQLNQSAQRSTFAPNDHFALANGGPPHITNDGLVGAETLHELSSSSARRSFCLPQIRMAAPPSPPSSTILNQLATAATAAATNGGGEIRGESNGTDSSWKKPSEAFCSFQRTMMSMDSILSPVC